MIHVGTYLLCFSPRRNHSTILPVVPCLKVVSPNILSNVTVIFSWKIKSSASYYCRGWKQDTFGFIFLKLYIGFI